MSILYIIQQQRGPHHWADYEQAHKQDYAMDRFVFWKEHREKQTGPSTHWRLIKRTEVLVISTQDK